jgi:nitrite reductase (NO-forming)
MTAQTLSDEEVANVLTYAYNSWGNSKKDVTPAMVKSVRNK